MHRSIYMVEQLTRPGEYRSRSASARTRLVDADRVRLVGVDGDEEANTVTYWYDITKED